jgi:hypothetical protein
MYDPPISSNLTPTSLQPHSNLSNPERPAGYGLLQRSNVKVHFLKFLCNFYYQSFKKKVGVGWSVGASPYSCGFRRLQPHTNLANLGVI